MARKLIVFSIVLILAFASTVDTEDEKTEVDQKTVDKKADKKYKWLKKSIAKKAKHLDQFDFVKAAQKKLAEQEKVKNEARKYAIAKNQKIMAERMKDLESYYPYINKNSGNEEGSEDDMPVYLDDESWSGYWWSYLGYPIQTKLPTSNPLTQYYLQNKQTSVRLNEDGKLYLSVSKY
jgi:hypothetical protein